MMMLQQRFGWRCAVHPRWTVRFCLHLLRVTSSIRFAIFDDFDLEIFATERIVVRVCVVSSKALRAVLRRNFAALSHSLLRRWAVIGRLRIWLSGAQSTWTAVLRLIRLVVRCRTDIRHCTAQVIVNNFYVTMTAEQSCQLRLRFCCLLMVDTVVQLFSIRLISSLIDVLRTRCKLSIFCVRLLNSRQKCIEVFGCLLAVRTAKWCKFYHHTGIGCTAFRQRPPCGCRNRSWLCTTTIYSNALTEANDYRRISFSATVTYHPLGWMLPRTTVATSCVAISVWAVIRWRDRRHGLELLLETFQTDHFQAATSTTVDRTVQQAGSGDVGRMQLLIWYCYRNAFVTSRLQHRPWRLHITEKFVNTLQSVLINRPTKLSIATKICLW